VKYAPNYYGDDSGSGNYIPGALAKGYAGNAAVAVASHLEYFGRDDVEFRSNDSEPWLPIVSTVVHREVIAQRKTPSGWQKLTGRHVFVQNYDVTGSSVVVLVYVQPNGQAIHQPDGVSRYIRSNVTAQKNLNLKSSFRLDGQVYTVDALTRATNNRIDVHLVRNAAMEVARPSYRMR
jgi:hypothetical protein